MASSSKRFSTNFKLNLKKGFGKDALIDDACALGAPILYTILPTVLGLSGWMAMFVGFIVPYGLGKLFNVPSMGHAAIGIAATHLIYSKGGGTVAQLLSKPIWTMTGTPTGYETAAQTAAGTLPPGTTGQINSQPMNGLNEYITAGDTQLIGYNPQEIENAAYNLPTEEISNSTINDWIRVAPQPQLAGVTWDDDESGSGY